jgi:hypothetical protein
MLSDVAGQMLIESTEIITNTPPSIVLFVFLEMEEGEINWLVVFWSNPIVQRLAGFLTIEDLFRLSQLNKKMHHEWTRLSCVDAVHMRELVFRRFRWKYTTANPFVFVRKNMLQWRLPLQHRPDTFRCTGGCGKRKKAKHLVSRLLSPVAVCTLCYCKPPSVLLGCHEMFDRRLMATHTSSINVYHRHRCHIAKLLRVQFHGQDANVFLHWMNTTDTSSFHSTVPNGLGDILDCNNVYTRHFHKKQFSVLEYSNGPYFVALEDVNMCAEHDVKHFKMDELYLDYIRRFNNQQDQDRESLLKKQKV